MFPKLQAHRLREMLLHVSDTYWSTYSFSLVKAIELATYFRLLGVSKLINSKEQSIRCLTISYTEPFLKTPLCGVLYSLTLYNILCTVLYDLLTNNLQSAIAIAGSPSGDCSFNSLCGARKVVTNPSAAAMKAMMKTSPIALDIATRTPSLIKVSAPGIGSRICETSFGSRPAALRFDASRRLSAAPITLTPSVPPIERLNCIVEVATPR